MLSESGEASRMGRARPTVALEESHLEASLAALHRERLHEVNTKEGAGAQHRPCFQTGEPAYNKLQYLKKKVDWNKNKIRFPSLSRNRPQYS